MYLLLWGQSNLNTISIACMKYSSLGNNVNTEMQVQPRKEDTSDNSIGCFTFLSITSRSYFVFVFSYQTNVGNAIPQ